MALQRPECTGRRLHGMAYICQRLGVTRQQVDKIRKTDPAFAAICVQLTPNGNLMVDEDDLEHWIEGLKRKRMSAFVSSAQGAAGVHVVPPDMARKDAEADLRCIIVNGDEPPYSQHWRNAQLVRGDLPLDIAAAFDLAPNASFKMAVERADALIALPLEKRADAMKDVAARLSAYHDARAEV